MLFSSQPSRASTMTAQSRFPVPSPADAEVARASSERLAAFLHRDRRLTLSVTGAHGQEAVELPASVGPLLLEILRDMAAGSAVAVLRKDAELTTQQAADFLDASVLYPAPLRDLLLDSPYRTSTVRSGPMPSTKGGPARCCVAGPNLRQPASSAPAVSWTPTSGTLWFQASRNWCPQFGCPIPTTATSSPRRYAAKRTSFLPLI